MFPQPVLDAFGAAPDHPVFEHGSRIVRGGEVLEIIGRLAAGMRDVGLGRGRGVAIATAVSPEAFAAHIAAHTLGCRVVGIRPGYPHRQLAHVLGAGIDAVVVDPTTATGELVEAAWPATVLSLGACDIPSVDLLASPAADLSSTVDARADDVARLVYTSGSTGQPKGCMHTYGAMSDLSLWRRDRWCPGTVQLAERTERYLLFGTLGSVVVMEFLALCLLNGGTAVIPDPDPVFPRVIERHRITATIMTVPRLYQLLSSLDEVDLGTLRGVMVSGSPLPPRRLAEATELLGPVVFQNYGQSESGSLTMLTPQDIASGSARALSSVGRPHSHIEVSIRDADGRPVRGGAVGEIHVRPFLMSGYWNDPEQTADVLVDGWLRTRDLGRLDDDGYLHLAGRARDVIIVNALPYYAGPIEQALATHPDVAQAYVVGAPDEHTGEAVHAYVVPTASRILDLDALAKLVRAELGEACVPKTITLVSEAPTAPSGKPDKRALLTLYPPATPG